ncbi:glycosyltransferase family 9 protein [Prosthecobacter fluviatilis]|uniref:Glycosyltransferase family 9 protein n=1 Tax=Prosthecobacter fluviatilis TaxID=445931 RepID=A0ABW0KSW4_9BACT
MGWKRSALESLVWIASRFAASVNKCPDSPQSIFVLRNNDLGDLLVITPLFEALKMLYPEARIVAGVGDWSRPILENNPHVSEVLSINAPWHNHIVPGQTPLGAFRYILRSHEVSLLKSRQFDIGIDVLGSQFGSLLLMRGGIPFRLGVKGYAGGHSAAQRYFDLDYCKYVGRSSLLFAELLGAMQVPSAKPQIFLTAQEMAYGDEMWAEHGGRKRRIVIGPGAGFAEKCWPLGHYEKLIRALTLDARNQVVVVGGPREMAVGAQLSCGNSAVRNLTGLTTLRETFSLVAQADLVICNSSLLMHVAAAFEKPSVVLLGEWFDSAALHALQWGYGSLTHVCGRDQEHEDIYSPEEVLDLVSKL